MGEREENLISWGYSKRAKWGGGWFNRLRLYREVVDYNTISLCYMRWFVLSVAIGDMEIKTLPVRLGGVASTWSLLHRRTRLGQGFRLLCGYVCNLSFDQVGGVCCIVVPVYN